MEYNISKLNLDIQTDVYRTQLAKFASEKIPDKVRNAEMMTPDELALLSDGDFALILATKDGEELRRFPIVDAAHTWFSVKYFLANKDKLPEEARMIAATNLDRAMTYWGIEEADGEGEILCEYDRDDLKPGTRRYKEGKDENIGDLKGAESFSKQASLDPHVANAEKARVNAMLASIEAGRADGKSVHDAGEKAITDYYAALGPQPAKQASVNFKHKNRYNEHPDDAGKLMGAIEKMASARTQQLPEDSFALVIHADGNGIQKMFNISTPALLKTAMALFEDNYLQMDPRYRRQMGQNMNKKASAFKIPASSRVKAYGNETKDNDMLKIALRQREEMVSEDKAAILGVIKQKVASLNPTQLAEFLYEFDKTAGISNHWDGMIPDPFMSVFGMPKMASSMLDPIGVALGMYKQANVAGYDITPEDLQTLAMNPGNLRSYLDEQMLQAFSQDPVEFFNSLPKPHQEIIVNFIKGTIS